MKNKDEMLFWVDIETFGLDPNRDPILEVGFHVTDLDLNTIANKSWLIWGGAPYEARLNKLKVEAREGVDGAAYVLNMHTESNLWEDCKIKGRRIELVQDEIVEWIKDNNFNELPMCGSSVSFDKTFLQARMPEVAKLFHYRIIDVSSVKELCRRYNPSVYSKLTTSVNKIERHRADPDLIDTINEFKFYRNEFLLW